MSNYFEAIEGIRRVSQIRRYSGMFQNIPQSVSDHCFNTAVLGFLLARNIKKENTENSENTPDEVIILNPERVAIRALFHDVGEAFTGDIPYHFRNRLVKEFADRCVSMSRIESSFIDELTDNYPDDVRNLIKFFIDEDDESDPNYIVMKFSDVLESVIHSYEEMSTGNDFSRVIFENGLSVIREKLDKNTWLKCSMVDDIINKFTFNMLY